MAIFSNLKTPGIFKRLFRGPDPSRSELVLIETVAEAAELKDKLGLPFYFWGDIKDGIKYVYEQIPDEKLREFLFSA